MIVSPKFLKRRRCIHKKNELDETLDLKSSEDMICGHNDKKNPSGDYGLAMIVIADSVIKNTIPFLFVCPSVPIFVCLSI